MKSCLSFLASFALFVPLAAQSAQPAAPQGDASKSAPAAAPFFGVVAAPTEWAQALCAGAGLKSAVLVQLVAPDSPAARAGLQTGDLLLRINGQPLAGKEDLIAQLRRCRVGDTLNLEYWRHGVPSSILVHLDRAARGRVARRLKVDDAVGGDRIPRQRELSPEIRRKIEEQKAEICQRLSLLPDGFQPLEVSRLLQNIRHLARDANQSCRGWMSGEAGEVTIQFKDAEGSLLLRGANKLVGIEVYDREGKEVFRGQLDRPEDIAALPEDVLRRLKNLH